MISFRSWLEVAIIARLIFVKGIPFAEIKRAITATSSQLRKDIICRHHWLRIKNSYFIQIPMKENSKDCTTFVSSRGSFRFKYISGAKKISVLSILVVVVLRTQNRHSVRHIFICPITIAYSMGQIIKSFCICACGVRVCVRLWTLSRLHFFVDFHQIGHRRVNPQK